MGLAAAWRVAPEMVLAGAGATELLHFFARVGWHGPVALVTPVWPAFHRASPRPPSSAGRSRTLAPARSAGPRPARQSDRRGDSGEHPPPRHRRAPKVPFWSMSRSSISLPSTPPSPGAPTTPTSSCSVRCPVSTPCPACVSAPWSARPPRLHACAAAASPSPSAFSPRPPPSPRWPTRNTPPSPALSSPRNAAGCSSSFGALDGLQLTPGAANFLFASTARPAQQVVDWFLDRRILLDNCTGQPGIPGQAIRFAVRTRPENERFVAAAREYFCATDQPVVETP